jgi:ankyrin repeat protein
VSIFDAIQAGDRAAVAAAIAADPGEARARNPANVSALMMALYMGRRDIADIIRANCGDLDVFEAVSYGEPERLRALLAGHPSLVSAYASDGFTPLHFAGFFNQEAAADVLLERGAPVDAVTRNDMANQPLHAAAAGGNVRICEKIIAAGADVNARQHGGFTPLHEAALRGDEAMAELYLRAGADRSLLADDGKTALDIAREHGHLAIVELLEAAG